MDVATRTFGEALRWWRTERRYSQLRLAADAEVSTRHLSFLETGKARPSREMVIHLATVLDLPLRDRNAVLHAAGYSPSYSETALDAPDTEDVRAVLKTVLDAHMPNPATVVDRRGDIVDANAAAFALLGALVDADSAALEPTLNVNRVTLHPDGVRARTKNWTLVASTLLQRIERELAHRPADRALADVYEEALGYPDVADLRRNPELPTGADLLVDLHVETMAGEELRLISTIATIGAPYDITLEELRLETFFPTDDRTRQVLDRWAVTP